MTDKEAHFLGAFVAAIGLGTMAASLVRLLAPGWPADAYLATFGAACGAPLVLAVGVMAWVWAQGELSRNRVNELDAKARLERLQQPAQQAVTLSQQPTREQQDAAVRGHHWRQMAHRFITAGDMHGFGIRVLAKNEPTKVISWSGWGEMTKVLRDAGVLAGSGDGTKWANDWDYHLWLEQKDRVALPHPDKEPPIVEIAIRNATTQQSATPAPASRAVVDHPRASPGAGLRD